MATPVYHINCYKEAKGRDASPKPAKWNGFCAHCSKRIFKGDLITWTRRQPEGQAVQAPSHHADNPFKGTPEGEMMQAAQAEAEEEEQPEPMPVSAKPADTEGLLNVGLLAEALKPYMTADLERKINHALANLNVPKVQRIEVITAPNADPVDCGIQHKSFPKLLKVLQARKNVWVAGPAGSGKTSAAKACAKALGLGFFYTGSVSEVFSLFGYRDANGNYVRTSFREAYEHGGIFLFDEVDGSDPNALVAFNAAIENGVAAFPDGMIVKHADCIIIAAANTWGHGGTAEYIGRNKLDAATLNRFVFMKWDYDEALETATCPNLEWCKRVQQVRARVKAKGLRVLVTPRASYYGADLLAVGLPQADVEEMVLKAGMTDEQWGQVSH